MSIRKQGDVQHAFPKDGAHQGLPGLAHGLELMMRGVAQGHHGHGDDHPPQEPGGVVNGGGVVDEQGGQLGANPSKSTRQTRAKSREIPAPRRKAARRFSC